jgi:transposase
MPQAYCTQRLDHLGSVAGMFEERGIGAVIDHAAQQHPETRLVTVGHAVKAMFLNGLGFVHQPRYLVPLVVEHKPTHRLIPRGIAAPHLNDDTLGCALDTFYDHGIRELYSFVAVTAVQRVGRFPRFVHLDSTSFHVAGRYNSAEEPDATVIHITRGYSRDYPPDLNQVMLNLLVEHQAGIPPLMQPLSGNTSDGSNFGRLISEPIARLHTADGMTYLVADSVPYSAENLHKLAQTGSAWITRAPATLTAAQAASEQITRKTMMPHMQGYRYRMLAST